MKETIQTNRTERKTHSEFAVEIMRDFHFYTLKDTEEMLVYENGVYKLGGEIVIKEECEKRIENCGSSFCNEIVNTIQRRTYVDRSEFDRDPRTLNLKNGLINLETEEFREHTPNYLSRVQLPVIYNPKAGCVKFMEFLIQCLPNPKDRITVLEEFASALRRDLNLEKIYMHLGGGGNGKSTMFYVVEEFLGKDNVSNIPIHDLVSNRFAKAELDGKLANIYADIETDELSKLGTLKALASRDDMQVEKKNKNPFKLRPFAQYFFSTNKLPELRDYSDAVFRRFIVTEWKEKFRLEKDQEGHAKNPNLKYELTTEEELSGVLNLLIKVCKKLVTKGALTYEQSIKQLRKEWKEKADPISQFIRSCLVQDINEITPKQTVYDIYEKWCEKNNHFLKSNRRFNKELRDNTDVEEDTIKINGKPTKVWRGVALNMDNKIVTEVTSVTSSNYWENNENKG